ncbi:uncharacterized protein MONBRDRAFT_26438 [Monosiga brevicollis MX1]|uniref:Hyaluronan/mRNA-binding protein domain-containing protein n=1 Tax=Monosiga brevicollis TaxID=81824 RepID=A9V2D3_MONBE|nr:uncharacterized protein MONBRDRAFT_26438 [Monosiga brevicollis MX1]EDQ88356.1 predicted protein [Monosiga brevicollis MX1]|eukprot:XP_001746949.1 hypothetical protein [Monosiga brevicollis MX1]
MLLLKLATFVLGALGQQCFGSKFVVSEPLPSLSGLPDYQRQAAIEAQHRAAQGACKAVGRLALQAAAVHEDCRQTAQALLKQLGDLQRQIGVIERQKDAIAASETGGHRFAYDASRLRTILQVSSQHWSQLVAFNDDTEGAREAVRTITSDQRPEVCLDGHQYEAPLSPKLRAYCQADINAGRLRPSKPAGEDLDLQALLHGLATILERLRQTSQEHHDGVFRRQLEALAQASERVVTNNKVQAAAFQELREQLQSRLAERRHEHQRLASMFTPATPRATQQFAALRNLRSHGGRRHVSQAQQLDSSLHQAPAERSLAETKLMQPTEPSSPRAFLSAMQQTTPRSLRNDRSLRVPTPRSVQDILQQALHEEDRPEPITRPEPVAQSQNRQPNVARQSAPVDTTPSSSPPMRKSSNPSQPAPSRVPKPIFARDHTAQIEQAPSPGVAARASTRGNTAQTPGLLAAPQPRADPLDDLASRVAQLMQDGDDESGEGELGSVDGSPLPSPGASTRSLAQPFGVNAGPSFGLEDMVEQLSPSHAFQTRHQLPRTPTAPTPPLSTPAEPAARPTAVARQPSAPLETESDLVEAAWTPSKHAVAAHPRDPARARLPTSAKRSQARPGVRRIATSLDRSAREANDGTGRFVAVTPSAPEEESRARALTPSAPDEQIGTDAVGDWLDQEADSLYSDISVTLDTAPAAAGASGLDYMPGTASPGVARGAPDVARGAPSPLELPLDLSLGHESPVHEDEWASPAGSLAASQPERLLLPSSPQRVFSKGYAPPSGESLPTSPIQRRTSSTAPSPTYRTQGFKPSQIKQQAGAKAHAGKDHHSGVSSDSKKHGSGAHNWGSASDDIKQGLEEYHSPAPAAAAH